MADFWSGKDSKLVLFQDNTQVALDIMSWSVKPNGVKVADGVCGEDRDRLQFITNFYEITIEAKQQVLEAIAKFMEDQDNADARAVTLQKAAGILIYPLNGTQSAFQASEVTLDDWEMGARGRTERNNLNVPLRARYFSPIPTL